MATEKLKTFLQKKVGSVAPEFNWVSRRDQYLAALRQLYDQIINDFLGQETADFVAIERSLTTIREAFLGAYEAPSLVLSIGKQQVEFRPKGTVIANAAGLVEVIGEAAEVVLTWDGNAWWTIIYSRTPKLSTAPLTETSFLDILRTVMS